MDVEIRHEHPGDAEAIRTLTEEAFRGQPFASGSEAGIVDRLREASALSVSLVACCDGRIVGHVAVSPVETASGDVGWYGLGPISVGPDLQRKGIGSKLMHAALDRLRDAGALGCVLVGHPGYYGRFGFRADGSASVDGAPAEATFCLKLRATQGPGAVRFHEAFGMH